jgi:hypothetical protein
MKVLTDVHLYAIHLVPIEEAMPHCRVWIVDDLDSEEKV